MREEIERNEVKGLRSDLNFPSLYILEDHGSMTIKGLWPPRKEVVALWGAGRVAPEHSRHPTFCMTFSHGQGKATEPGAGLVTQC
jgi:hypothetical protein